MHIPDAFIPITQAAVYWIIALIFIALSLRWARREMSEDKVPLVAVIAAGIFAIQAVNIPIPGLGISGHMMGAALAAIVLGSPFAGVFILTLVLIVQGIMAGDGGITVMGANIINMGVVGSFAGYYSYRMVQSATGNMTLSAFIAGWTAVFLSAILTAFELIFAGLFPLREGLILMGSSHAVIGLIEGGLTFAALYLISTARPDLLEEPRGVRA